MEEEEENENDGEEITLNVDETLCMTDQDNQPELICSAHQLEFVYRQELLEILNVYRLAHESDLWCRNASNSTSGELEDTAYTELEQLVNRTRSSFFHYCVQRCVTSRFDEDMPIDELCGECRLQQQGLAIACYHKCYSGENASDRAPILSLPWLFVTPLLAKKWLNPLSPTPSLLASALECTLSKLIREKSLALPGAQLTFCLPNDRNTRATASVDYSVCVLVEIIHSYLKPKRCRPWPLVLSRFIRETPSFQWLSPPSVQSEEWQLIIGSERKRLMIEIDPNYVAGLLSLNWTVAEDERMYIYFEQLLEICFKEGRATNDTDYLQVSEHIILALQRLAIDETISK